MTKTHRAPRFADLPGEIPIFPLEGALLLPGGQLPLNIFEPRYLAMVDDALAGARLIGMIQPRPEHLTKEEQAKIDQPGVDQPRVDQPRDDQPRDDPFGEGRGKGDAVPPPVFDIGCAGRITSMDETDDGRYLITLTGVCRFRVGAEIEGRAGYRRVRPDWSGFAGDFETAEMKCIDRARLSRVLHPYFDQHGISANWQAIEDTGDERLITSLSMICPLEVPEKQALLEVQTMAERGAMLISLLEMAVMSGDEDEIARH